MKEKNCEDYYEEYVQINDIKQYFLHYPKESDIVVLYLHGGMTEAQLTYKTVLRDRKYSLVYYDQRGTGKTQAKNKSKPKEVTLEALMKDLDVTINYVRQKYPHKKLVLLGHSRGSILGMEYIKRYSTKVDAYVGVGQLVNFNEGQRITFDHCYELAGSRDKKKIEIMRNNTGALSPESLQKACVDLEKMQTKYKLAGYKDGNFKLMSIVMKSPVFVLSDMIPIITAMKTNINLFPCVGRCDLHSYTTFSIPIYFLCGKNDWQAPGSIVEKYYAKITAPKKGLYWIENAGHFTDLDNPKEYTKVLNEIL